MKLNELFEQYYATSSERNVMNFKSSYNGFITYMTSIKYLGCSNYKDMFEKITIVDIRNACAKYYENSKRVHSTQAIHRFLLAM